MNVSKHNVINSQEGGGDCDSQRLTCGSIGEKKKSGRGEWWRFEKNKIKSTPPPHLTITVFCLKISQHK